MPARAIFLDKDGTVLEDVAYNVRPERMRFLPGAAEGLRMLSEAGYRLIVISNQSGVARGLFEEAALQDVERRLAEMCREQGVVLSGFYYCPHHPAGAVPQYAIECGCRKPAAGLLLQAADRHGVDLARSWMVGDILDDVEAGNRAGCRTALLVPGGEDQWRRTPLREPHLTARDLKEAACKILAASEAGLDQEGAKR